MNDLDMYEEKKDEKKEEKKDDSKVMPYLAMIIFIVFVIVSVFLLITVNWGAVILGWLGFFGAVAVGIGAYVAFMSVSPELSNFPRRALKILIIIAALFLISLIIGLTW